MINRFNGQYRFLSNFWPAEVMLDDVVYPTVEHAYQAAKFHSDNFTRQRIKAASTPGEAKKLGRSPGMRDEWERVKIDVMRDLLRQKFAPNTPLATSLIETGDEELIEGNTWGDTFWGVCNGFGDNWLGHLLVGIRRELRDE